MWKIDWNVLERINPRSAFNKDLKALIGDKLITEVRYNKGAIAFGDDIGVVGVSIQGLNDKIIASYDGGSPDIFDSDYTSTFVILSSKESKALIKVEEDTKTGHNVDFYMFLGDCYKTLDEVTKAIEEHSEDDGNEQTYYYEHHNVVEYSHKIEASEKLIGGFDQETLDKVNEILKMKGVEFTIKGDK